MIFYRSKPVIEEDLVVSQQSGECEISGEQGRESVPSTTFTPGKIHEMSCREFWVTTLKANAWVLDTLQHGYALPFHTVPDKICLGNNLSARRDEAFVREEVTKLALQGVVQLVDYKPDVVSPLTVATSSAGKKRLCLDLSRSVNPCITTPAVILADLKSALKITEVGDWQGIYDLASAYHHIKIYPGHVKYLGAAFKKQDGTTQYFVYIFLPFGLSSAVHVMTKIMKPVSAFIASKGIRHTIYLDDGRVVAGSQAQAVSDLAEVLDIMGRAGWIIALDKSDTPVSVAQSKQYLGFIIDTAEMTVRLSANKEIRLRQMVKDIISCKGRRIKTKTLAKMLGTMISTAPALGRIPLIFARPAYALLEQEVEVKGWAGSLQVTSSAVDSLRGFLTNLSQFNGNPIAHTNKAMSLISLIGPPDKFFTAKILPTHVPDLPQEVFVSDASNVAVCSYSLSHADKFYFVGHLEEKHATMSSGYRELLAVKMALQAKEAQSGAWKERTNIFWLTDSENMVVFLTKGSAKAHIQQLVLEIMKIAQRLRIIILPIHLRREDPRIKVADAGSRVRDSDDWSIDPNTFKQLELSYGPFSIDLFADSSNAKTTRFFSNFLCPQTEGVDAFSHSWDGENAWICPPVSAILKVFRKLRQEKMTGLLIVPAWSTADFWPMLFPRNQDRPFYMRKTFEINPIIIQNQRACSPMSGKNILCIHGYCD